MSEKLMIVKRPTGAFYEVQLENSNNLKWREIDGNTSVVKFTWDGLDIVNNQNMNDLIIEVSRTYLDKSKEEIRSIAKSIKQSLSIEKNDKIFGYTGSFLEKIGYVDLKQVDHQNLLVINWIEQDSKIFKFTEQVINRTVEVQKLTIGQLKQIEKHVGVETMSIIYSFLPESGDNNEYRSDEKFYESIVPEISQNKIDRGGIVKLFYATNRGKEKASKVKYNNICGNLQLGFCEVSIPKGHIQGELERPGRILWWEFPENEKEHVIVKSIKEYELNSFYKEFSSKVSETKSKDILLFVHGYNTSFEEAARRSAQLTRDLPFDGVSGFYSWPSAGKLISYFEDEANARASVPEFKKFIEQIVQIPEVNKLHIIAHSMGSLVLSLSINRLKDNVKLIQLIEAKIQQIILGAPDIDQDEFRNVILPEFNKIGIRRTIYASDHDMALNASSNLRMNKPRLGQVGKEIFLDSMIDTIEVSNIDVKNSHGYIYESKSLLGDMYYLLGLDLSPENRRLRKIYKEKMAYWLFPQ